jgi:hypothetical protein
MPTQNPIGSANDYFKRKLFVDTGMNFMEVKARIVEPYTPPTPTVRTKELEVINAPSNFNSLGLGSYKIAINLLFATKEDYAEYMMWLGWTHKFYDERGQIYLGAVDSITPKPVYTSNVSSGGGREDKRGYLVEVSLVTIKKDVYDRKSRFQFQDLKDENQDDYWFKPDIQELADLGIVAVLNNDGSPVLYFRPSDYISRSEFAVFLNRTRRFLEKVIRE